MGIIRQVKNEFGIIKFDYKPYELEHIQEGNEILYALANPYLVYDLLITNKENLLDTEELKQMLEYIEYMVSTGVPDKMASPRKAVEKVVDAFWNLFPPFFRA